MKRGQMNEVFVYIGAFVAIVLIIILAIAGINTVLGMAESAKINSFSSSIRTDIEKHAKLFGAETDKSYDVPEQIDKAYFIDTKRLSTLNCKVDEKIPIRIKTIVQDECYNNVPHEDRVNLFFEGEDDFFEYRTAKMYLAEEKFLILPLGDVLDLHFEGKGGITYIESGTSNKMSYAVPSGLISNTLELQSKDKKSSITLNSGNGIIYPSGVSETIFVDTLVPKKAEGYAKAGNQRKRIFYQSDIYDYTPYGLEFDPIKLKIKSDENFIVFRDNVSEWIEVGEGELIDDFVEIEINSLGRFILANYLELPPVEPSCENSECTIQGYECCDPIKGAGTFRGELSNLDRSGKQCWDYCLN